MRFNESGSTTGNFAVLQTKQALHAPGPLHAADTQPLRLYAGTGSISGLTLFAGKAGRVFAGADITDISLYLQNVRATDISVVASGGDIIAYNPNSAAAHPRANARQYRWTRPSPAGPWPVTCKSAVPARSRCWPDAISISAWALSAPTAPPWA